MGVVQGGGCGGPSSAHSPCSEHLGPCALPRSSMEYWYSSPSRVSTTISTCRQASGSIGKAAPPGSAPPSAPAGRHVRGEGEGRQRGGGKGGGGGGRGGEGGGGEERGGAEGYNS